jgi:hypothetical protein
MHGLVGRRVRLQSERNHHCHWLFSFL